MIVTEAHLIYFSPTHTSKQVGEAIVHGMGMDNVLKTDLTLNSIEEIELPASALAVVVVPVYGGHVAPLAMERLESIRGTDTPVALVVVYGNRAYEKALMELDTFVLLKGFKVIGGATFIGEHSYSSEKYPIAANRPNAHDLEVAMEFGYKLRMKVEKASGPETLYPVNVQAIPRPQQPFLPLLGFFRKVMKLRKSGKPLPKAPWLTDERLCTHCGACVNHCPVGAILEGDETHTNADKCIKCCACVKSCTQKARVYDTPFAVLLSQYFARQKEPKTIL